MLDRLFVYGSLVSALRHPQGDRLRREATLLGAARIQARLYRVSWYPGVVLSSDAADRVEGELYRLHDAQRALAWLDAYEGIAQAVSSVAASDEYERIEVTVTLADATGETAWLYHYRRPVEGLKRVTTGRWSGGD